ncbi:H-type lectin domain-containing protein [Sphingomonas sp. DG1-23]|uniref:H-type lectin domain-containing protein n=1 Tax=Sphingomonas sp. DG1-23 TaxID=3068316 RepID=UPI00273F8595|nr:H-type lectin domain-containing protein [Sphingomonas sp. DG1-23]MDP5277949.1 H-type lectin domain-containing protein [Sphingomonas sp. DG1-23]
MKLFLSILAVCYASQAAAQDNCTSVISLARVRSDMVQARDQVEQHAANFCNEYRNARSSNRAIGLSASYRFLSGTFNSSSASAEEVASRYCSADSSFSRLSTAYQSYVESIAPGAFPAYEQCVIMSRHEVHFRVDPASVLPGQFVVIAYFRPQASGNTANLSYSSSSDVNCSWNGVRGIRYALFGASQATLNCRRTDSSRRSFVAIVRDDGGDQITLPWQAYNRDGVPVATMAELSARIAEVDVRRRATAEGLDRIGVQAGVISIAASGTRPLLDMTRCPEGPDASRGQPNGRIEFEHPFEVTPKVAIALSNIDIGGANPMDTHRLQVSVTSIDKRGFNYAFTTWCTTAIYGATASWIAASR